MHLSYSYNEIWFFYHSYLDLDVRDIEYRQRTHLYNQDHHDLSHVEAVPMNNSLINKLVLWLEISKIDRLMASSDIFFIEQLPKRDISSYS